MKVVYCATEGLKIEGLREWPLAENGDLSELPHVKKGDFMKRMIFLSCKGQKSGVFRSCQGQKWRGGGGAGGILKGLALVRI